MEDPENGDWLRASLLEGEDPDDHEVKLIKEEAVPGAPNSRWLKVALQHADGFKLRSISNVQDIPGYKSLEPSLLDGWFVDTSAMSADYRWWDALGNEMGWEPAPAP